MKLAGVRAEQQLRPAMSLTAEEIIRVCEALRAGKSFAKSLHLPRVADTLKTVKPKYRKLLKAEAFAPTPATREARKTALAMNLSPEERHRLAEAGARCAHARRRPKALAVA